MKLRIKQLMKELTKIRDQENKILAAIWNLVEEANQKDVKIN